MKKHKKSSSGVNSSEIQEADDALIIYENNSEEGNGDKTTQSSEETDTSTSARGVVKQKNHQRLTKKDRARAQNQDTGHLSIKQELKLEFNCPQCDNFYSYEGDFWKHQDNLRISLSNIACPEIQAQIIEMINNAQPKTEMETQTNEDIQLVATETEESQKQNPVNGASRNSQNQLRRVKKTSNKSRKIIQSLRIPDVRILRTVTARNSKRSQMCLQLNDKKLKNQSGKNLKKRNVRAVASSKPKNSKLQNQSETEESNRVLESGDMGNSEEARSSNRVQFAYKCLTCSDIIITTKKHLWDHVDFHEKALKESENSKSQNQLHRKESEILKKIQNEKNLKSTKQTQKMRTLKRKNDSDAVSSPKIFKGQSDTKNSDMKQSKRTLRSRAAQQNTIKIPVTTAESNKLRYRRESQLVEFNDVKKKKQKKNVPETEISKISIDPYFDCIENDQNFSEYQEDNQFDVSVNELNSSEGQVAENVNQVLRQSQEDSISTVDCQVRVKFTFVYWCDRCSEYCLSKQELVEHMQSHVKEIDKSTSEGIETKAKRQNDLDRLKIFFECYKCARRFKRRGILKKHLAIHSDVRSHHCMKCEKKFKTKSSLWSHQAVHNGARPYSCKKCRKTFKRSCELKTHQARHHSDLRSYKCKTCDKSFKTSSDLKEHQAVHNEATSHKCKKCGKTFKRSSNLKQHQARHSDHRPYKCKTCDKSFKTSSDLKEHQAVHNEARSHKCNECTLSFKRSRDLTQHQVRHHSDLRQHSCKTCDKSFKTKSDLWSHRHVHSNVKLHKCQRCSQKFKWKGKLTKHLKTCK